MTVRAYMRRLFETRGHLAFLGLVFPQTWMYVVSSGIVCAEQSFQVAFHSGMLACLCVVALLGLDPVRPASQRTGVDAAFAALMTAVPLAGLLPFEVAGPYALVVGALGGLGIGWCFSAWFRVLSEVPLRDGFCYVLLGFSLGALGCLVLKLLGGVHPTVTLALALVLPALSTAALRECRAVQKAASVRREREVAPDPVPMGNLVVLVVQVVAYALLFGNGFVFSVLQDNIHALPYGIGVSLLNYGLRALLPLVLMAWLVVQADGKGPLYSPVFKVLMLVAVFGLLGAWFIAGLDTLVAYALVATARSMVLMLLFLTCLKLTVMTRKSPWFVYGVGRGAYELSVIAGILGYGWLTRTFGPISLGEDLVYLTALCVLAFLTSCFFATAQSLGESPAPEPAPASQPQPEAPDHADLRARYNLNDREFQILMLFYRGNSKRRIAEQIGISENTVRWYLQQLYTRLGVHSRDELLELVDAVDESGQNPAQQP